MPKFKREMKVELQPVSWLCIPSNSSLACSALGSGYPVRPQAYRGPSWLVLVKLYHPSTSWLYLTPAIP
jgi:hypothetical protein